MPTQGDNHMPNLGMSHNRMSSIVLPPRPSYLSLSPRRAHDRPLGGPSKSELEEDSGQWPCLLAVRLIADVIIRRLFL